MTPQHRQALEKLIAAALAVPRDKQPWPWAAIAEPRALLVEARHTMFAYYLGVDGVVYQYDMDKFIPTFEPREMPEIYARAGELYPELAGITPDSR